MKQHSPAASMRERLAARCLELVRIPSATGDERAIADHVERWARGCHAFTRKQIVRHGNALVLHNLRDDDERPRIALLGHLDTVPTHPSGSAPRVEDGKVYGRGAADMKGGLAVMMALAEELDLARLPFGLLLVFYDHEEGAFRDNGLQPLLERVELLRHVELGVVMEPTDGTLQLGCLGSIHARFVYRGRAAHSARPWEGDNAIVKAASLLGRLRDRPVHEVDVEGLVFHDSMAVTRAHGGGALNVIPDTFELFINYRFAPRPPLDETIDTAVREVRALAPDAEIEIIDVAPPGLVPSANPIVEHLRALVELPVRPKEAWSDVARLAAHGIDAINFGPGSPERAHQADEWVSVDALAHGYEVLARLLTSPLEGVD